MSQRDDRTAPARGPAAASLPAYIPASSQEGAHYGQADGCYCNLAGFAASSACRNATAEVATSRVSGRDRSAQVPTRTGDVSLRSSAITLCAVMRPVLGFSEGMFSMVMLKLAESDSTSMR